MLVAARALDRVVIRFARLDHYLRLPVTVWSCYGESGGHVVLHFHATRMVKRPQGNPARVARSCAGYSCQGGPCVADGVRGTSAVRRTSEIYLRPGRRSTWTTRLSESAMLVLMALFLLPIYRALTAIHIQHHPLRRALPDVWPVCRLPIWSVCCAPGIAPPDPRDLLRPHT